MGATFIKEKIRYRNLSNIDIITNIVLKNVKQNEEDNIEFVKTEEEWEIYKLENNIDNDGNKDKYIKYGSIYGKKYCVKTNYGNWDNDFTLELWVSPSIQSSSLTTIFADVSEDIGLYWEKGDVVFRVSDTEQIRWAVTYSKKAMQIVGIYSVSSISLYIDGTQVANKSIDPNFRFTNENVHKKKLLNRLLEENKHV
jgi:hypothetical protein